MEVFMKKRITYDVNFKISLANEYATGKTTYTKLSEKYGIPRATIATWIQKSKKHNNGSLIIKPENRGFLDVTKELQATSKATESLTIVINGLELKSDLNTLLLLLQGAKHV